MWFVRVSVMLAVVQWASSVGGSPRFPTRIVPPFFCADPLPATPMISPITAATTARVRYVRPVMRHLPRGVSRRLCSADPSPAPRDVPPGPPTADVHGPVPARAPSRASTLQPGIVSAIEPDVVEARPFGLLVEAVELLRRRPEPVEVPVADRRHLLVPELVHLLPQ